MVFNSNKTYMKIPKKIDFPVEILQLKSFYKGNLPKNTEAVFDLVSFKDQIIFPLYYKNRIFSYCPSNGCFKNLPFENSSFHSLNIYKEKLFVSCFRSNSIVCYSLDDFSEVEILNFPQEFPIASLILDEKLYFVDYINSSLICMEMNGYYKRLDLSFILKNIKFPHSIKGNRRLICISFRFPSYLMLLKEFKLLKIKNLGKQYDVMSAYPISEKKIIFTCIKSGIYLYDIESNKISLVSKKIKNLTSQVFLGDKLYISSESDKCLYVFEDLDLLNS